MAKKTLMGNGRVKFYETSIPGIQFVSMTQAICSYPEHVHVSTFVFGFVLKGEAILLRDSRPERLTTGDRFVLRPYEPHALLSRRPCDLFNVCVDKESTGEILPIYSLERCILFFEREGILNDTEGLFVLATLGEWNPSAGEKVELPAEIATAREDLERHPDRKLALEAMARKACFDKYHFLRVFRKNAGLTPHRFQLLNRIRQAKPALRKPRPPAETALNAGFCDQGHFCKTFKKYVGMTPKEYRASCFRIADF